MIKKIVFTILVFTLVFPVYAGNSDIQQGFESFQETNNKITFSCKNQCIYLFGRYNGEDYIGIDVKIKGSGLLGYGFLSDQKITPGEVIKAESGNYKWYFSRLPYYSDIPSGMPMVILVDGSVTGELTVATGIDSFGEQLLSKWQEFWQPEEYGYYSINLLYGPKIGGNGFIGILNLIFIFSFLGTLFIMLLLKRKKLIKKTYIWFSIIFFLLYGIRFLYDQYNIIKKDIVSYVSANDEIQTFRNYSDIDAFSRFIKANIPLNNKGVIYVGYQDWPYQGFLKYQLWPNIEFDKKGEYVVVYGDGRFDFRDGQLIDKSQDDKVIFDKVSLLATFKDYSYILKFK